MKILLTTLNSKFIHSSLAIRYLKKYCESDFENLYIEEYTINNDLDYILAEIYKKHYDIVCFSCYIWNISETLEIAKNLKKINKDIKIILGGPEVSYDSHEVLEHNSYIDFIVYGEGEVTFKELLNLLVKGRGNLCEIKGLAYRNNGRICVNEERPLIKNLDDIPFPYDDLKGLENRIIYYESSRGCPFNCQYCLSSTIRGVRFFSIDRVKKDLKFFVDANVRQVKFVDRTFNANKKHCMEIMKYLNEIDNGKINFHFEITASLLDNEILDFLKNVRKGLFQFEIGVQSTNHKTIKEIKRTVNFNKLKIACEQLKSFGNIHLHLDLIAGLPYENYKSFLNSFDEVYNLKPDKLQLGFLKLLKGSGIRLNREKYGYIYKDRPPYEVLQNDFINYSEILNLKMIEEMVEIYYNSHDFEFSINFIVNNYFKRPSLFFESLAKYWENNGYHHISHKKEKLYEILLDFYKNNNFDKEEFFREILKFDYIRNKRGGNLLEIFDKVEIDDFKNRCHEFLQNKQNIEKYLPKYKGMTAKKIIKKVHFEPFKYDIFKLQGEKNLIEKSITVFLFDYDVENKDFGKSKYYKVNI
ncbi:B12-binding domain-containing radical SAM protein [Caminicella sporogenes]|uniref:B12-binding domain-containing radical SAM protein n=1 Tax=Caminicella sporogenes TaxID=166485 RepID=UPI002541B4DA|nr:B12-binding domain-containing radical SAM protein [Caminicella sporogenes]WIF94283.1 DUF4080 domain-containing protein [Caminicella sporogenes]